MKSVYDILKQLRNTSGKNDKLAILTQNAGNTELAFFLAMTYEPRVNFYQTEIVESFANPMSFDQNQMSQALVQEIVEKVAGREVTGHAAKSYLATLRQSFQNDWEREMLDMLIERSVQAGISVNSINKTWPGLVTDVPYMRCSLIKDLPKKHAITTWPWKSGVISQIKADGMFANVSHTATGKVMIESRNGSPFPLEYFDDLVKEVKAVIPNGYQVHGELLIFRNGVMLDREVGNGVFNKILQGGELPKGDRVVYQAWDCIPIEEAKAKNKYDCPYEQRFQYLNTILDTEITGILTTSIRLIEWEWVFSLREAYIHCRDAMKRGLEGTVIKHPNAIWEDSTSKGQVKLKLDFVVELKVVGMNAANKNSKNAALFGSLQCESLCGKLKVGVTGFKDDKRKQIFDNWNTYNGSIIAVCANGIMLPDADIGGFFSLFLPRYVEDRLDKREADSLVRIQQIEQDAMNLSLELAAL